MARPNGSKDRGKRRGRGEGTLERRGPTSWRLRVYKGTDPESGHPVQISRTVHATDKADALRQLRRFVTEVEQGDVFPHRGTVGYLLAEYLRHVEKARKRAQSTIESYQTVVRAHLEPALGKRPLDKLTTKDIDDYIAAKQTAGLADGTIRFHVAVLSGALAQAVTWDWIPRNPAARATMPERPRTARRAPSRGELAALIEKAADDPDLRTAVLLAAVTGCRRGELVGLRWSDVDWADGTLLIERQWIPGKGGDRLGPPKGGKVRRITLGPDALKLLLMYRAEQEERAARLRVEVAEDGWILSRDAGRTHWRPKGLTQEISDLGRRAGIDMTLHETRHHAATEMIGAGIDVYTAAFRLGHDPAVLLRTYAHLQPARDRAAAATIEASWRVLLPALEVGVASLDPGREEAPRP